PPRLEKAPEVGAFAEPGECAADSAGAGLLAPIAAAVALNQPLRVLLPVSRTPGPPPFLSMNRTPAGSAERGSDLGSESLGSFREKASGPALTASALAAHT